MGGVSALDIIIIIILIICIYINIDWLPIACYIIIVCARSIGTVQSGTHSVASMIGLNYLILWLGGAPISCGFVDVFISFYLAPSGSGVLCCSVVKGYIQIVK